MYLVGRWLVASFSAALLVSGVLFAWAFVQHNPWFHPGADHVSNVWLWLTLENMIQHSVGLTVAMAPALLTIGGVFDDVRVRRLALALAWPFIVLAALFFSVLDFDVWKSPPDPLSTWPEQSSALYVPGYAREIWAIAAPSLAILLFELLARPLRAPR